MNSKMTPYKFAIEFLKSNGHEETMSGYSQKSRKRRIHELFLSVTGMSPVQGLTKHKKEVKQSLEKRRKEYQAYIKSDKWKEIRNFMLAKFNYTCQVCFTKFSRRDLHVHHKHYRNFGNEQIEDLELMCEPCHMKHHHKTDKVEKKAVKKKIEKIIERESKPKLSIEEKRELARQKISIARPAKAKESSIKPRRKDLLLEGMLKPERVTKYRRKPRKR
jgi:5-methylcytosine-specific restriction endonuclease McrA